MLQYLIYYGQRGSTHRQLLWGLQIIFGQPRYLGEVVAEYAHLRTGGFLGFFLSRFVSLIVGWIEFVMMRVGFLERMVYMGWDA